MRIFASFSPLVIAIAIFYKGCCVAQQLANCFSGEACRDTPISFGVVEQCCNSSDVSRSYSVLGGEECVECRFTYRCYASEQCGSNPPPVSVTTFAINDGERVCCNGTFASWDVSSSPTGGSSCAMCPETTTTVTMSTAETTVPLTTIEVDSSSQSTDPDTTVNVDPAPSGSGGGCSTGCIIGIVVGCVALVLLIATVTVIAIVVLIIKK